MYAVRTSNSQYGGDWMCAEAGSLHQLRVPSIAKAFSAFSEYQTLRRRNRSKGHWSHRTLSTDLNTNPETAEVQTETSMKYPPIDKLEALNPLYFTSSQELGCMPPSNHHIPDRRFPKSNQFSQSFANRITQFAGLHTSSSRSKVHTSLDLFY